MGFPTEMLPLHSMVGESTTAAYAALASKARSNRASFAAAPTCQPKEAWVTVD